MKILKTCAVLVKIIVVATNKITLSLHPLPLTYCSQDHVKLTLLVTGLIIGIVAGSGGGGGGWGGDGSGGTGSRKVV